MKDFDEEGIKSRYLARYARLKAKYGFTNKEFGEQIGHPTPQTFITLLKSGKIHITLEILMRSYNRYPEIDLMYILANTETPGYDIPNLQGANIRGKAGRPVVKDKKTAPNIDKYPKEKRDALKKLIGDKPPGIE